VTRPSEENPISVNDLLQLASSIANGRNTSAANDFLVSAHRLHSSGQYRSAILEAYAAVEYKVRNFPDSVSHVSILDRFDHLQSASLKKDFERFGITKTIHYLIPILFPEISENKLLEQICRLGEVRQSVSHNGSRKIDAAETMRLIVAAENFCDFIDSKTIK